MVNEKYAIKWDIEFSEEYQEFLLNLFAQEYFGELWEIIMRNGKEVIKLLVKEVNKKHFDLIKDNFDVFKNGKVGKDN